VVAAQVETVVPVIVAQAVVAGPEAGQPLQPVLEPVVERWVVSLAPPDFEQLAALHLVRQAMLLRFAVLDPTPPFLLALRRAICFARQEDR
jgi:hypothetical protein